MGRLAGKLLLLAATGVSNGFVLRRHHPRACGIGSLQQSDTCDAIQDDVGADCGEGSTSTASDPDASARRKLLATTLAAGCGCCGSAIQAAGALELSERRGGPYDSRRNALVDTYFAKGFVTS